MPSGRRGNNHTTPPDWPYTRGHDEHEHDRRRQDADRNGSSWQGQGYSTSSGAYIAATIAHNSRSVAHSSHNRQPAETVDPRGYVQGDIQRRVNMQNPYGSNIMHNPHMPAPGSPGHSQNPWPTPSSHVLYPTTQPVVAPHDRTWSFRGKTSTTNSRHSQGHDVPGTGRSADRSSGLTGSDMTAAEPSTSHTAPSSMLHLLKVIWTRPAETEVQTMNHPRFGRNAKQWHENIVHNHVSRNHPEATKARIRKAAHVGGIDPNEAEHITVSLRQANKDLGCIHVYTTGR